MLEFYLQRVIDGRDTERVVRDVLELRKWPALLRSEPAELQWRTEQLWRQLIQVRTRRVEFRAFGARICRVERNIPSEFTLE